MFISDYNAKVSRTEGKIPSISGLATTFVLTAVESKITSVSNLVEKTVYDTKPSELEKNLQTINMTNILLLQSLTS